MTGFTSMPLRPFGLCLLLLVAGVGCTITAPPTAPTSIHWEKYSDDIFTRAEKEKKLVLLDLEAVWCHWCHVQDHTTYADPKVIALINARYIAVKVDQDSRPDLANRYEDYGWPATILFSSDGREIAKKRGYIEPARMAAMLQAFIDDPRPGPSVKDEARVEFGYGTSLPADLRKELGASLDKGYDAVHGSWGFGHKYLDWDATEYSLIRARAGDREAERRARQTLDAALKLIDPVWGGVYQYSTDGDWDHPHFEKLMQFQAELLRIYSLADAQWHDARYRKAADALRGYIATFLTAPDGAFYVSQDADVVPGEHSGSYFAQDDAGRRKLGIPRVDTHCYARENGWAIQGVLAYYARTQNPEDLKAAIRAAEWVIANRSLGTGGFRHGENDATGPFLGDTLAMGRAFLALYEATADRAWLVRAQGEAFWITGNFELNWNDSKMGAGFGTVANPSNPLAAGPRPQIDENIAAARFFNLLSYYTGRKGTRDAGKEALRFLATPQVARSRGFFVAGLLMADAECSAEPLHVTVVGRKDDPAARALFMEALKSPTAYRRIEWFDAAEGKLPNGDVEYPALPNAAAFVCAGTTCSSPITDVAKLGKKLTNEQ